MLRIPARSYILGVERHAPSRTGNCQVWAHASGDVRAIVDRLPSSLLKSNFERLTSQMSALHVGSRVVYAEVVRRRAGLRAPISDPARVTNIVRSLGAGRTSTDFFNDTTATLPLEILEITDLVMFGKRTKLVKVVVASGAHQVHAPPERRPAVRRELYFLKVQKIASVALIA